MTKNKNHITPPKLAERLLLWFLRHELAEEVLGDLDEKFYVMLEKHSAGHARRNYWYQVLKYLRPFAMKKQKLKRYHNTMFKHNIIISYRSFMRFKSTFFINLIGLSSGLACALFIYLWMADELKTDRFHEKGDRIYQVLKHNKWGDQMETMTYTPRELAGALAAEFPEVELAVAVNEDWSEKPGHISYEQNQFKATEQHIDPNFFRIFSYKLLQGDVANPVPNTRSVLVSDELAEKLFGQQHDVVGKVLTWVQEEMSGDYVIAGVFQAPKRSSKNFDLLFSEDLMLERHDNYVDWDYNNDATYLLMNEGVDVAAFNEKIENFLKTKNERIRGTLSVQLFEDRHLYGDFENGIPVGGRVAYIRLFGLIGVFILIIACINFMNLTTAKASNRLKEIGVKKAIGARRTSLATQYLSESLLMTFIAILGALVLVIAFLPYFNQITGKDLILVLDSTLIIGSLTMLLVVGLLAGSYPALYLSAISPIATLKGKLSNSVRDIWVRKGLVVFQFTLSTIFIVAVIVISAQIDFVQSKKLGYDRENVVYIDIADLPDNSYQTFHNRIKQLPGVINTAWAGHSLTGDNGRTSGLSWPGKQEGQNVRFTNLEMGAGFIETMGIELMAGRTYEPGRQGEDNKIIFNEKAIEAMGLEDPIGTTVKVWGRDRQIIGVVKDFHTNSLHSAIGPTMIQSVPYASQTLIKLRNENLRETMTKVEAIYEEYISSVPFEYHFVDTAYERLYLTEQRVSALAQSFSVIAIIISCLGLFGLTAFTAERRSKEIGIRKVLGSGNWRIIQLLSTDMVKMVVMAMLVGLPVSYFLAETWMTDFAYSISLSWWFFALAGMVTLCIAWMATGLQTVRAARANPVESLRSE